MPGRLSGLSTIITGGAGGIGSACARLFCQEGASVLLVDRDADACRAAASDISDHVVEAKLSYLALDLAEEKSATEVVASALEKFGRLDCVVNNAGIRSYEPLSAAQSKTWHDILAINLLSYAYLCREALPELRRSGTGSIVCLRRMASIQGRAWDNMMLRRRALFR
jgi:2-hydroxycyclohexanecarboxyl-CoA dehydrogenase